MRVLSLIVLTGTGLLLAGCATPAAQNTTGTAPANVRIATSSSVAQASANLTSASGSLASGRMVLVPMGDGVHVTGEVGGLSRNGVHAFHIHEHGDCSAADASSAGGHFNPKAQPHGRAGHGPHHLGDADNLRADANGVARVDAHFSGVVLGGDAANNVIGKAIVVHAAPDDYQSQPAGNAGARIACGVIR